MIDRRRTFSSLLAVSCLALISCTSHTSMLGDRLADEGDWDRAVSAYRDAVRKDPFNEKLIARLASAKEMAAERHYLEARAALAEQRLADALMESKAALGLDPSKPEHHAAMNDALRLKEAREQLQLGEKLVNLGRQEDAVVAYERALDLDPSLTSALASITDLTKQLRAAKSLGGSTQPITLRFQNAKLKEVFEIVARTAGVNVIFDKEVRDEPVTIFLKDLPFDEALTLILNTNNLVAQRVTPETLLILPNNKQKQAQYQDLLMRTFYLSNAKAKEAVNLLRTMLESKKIYVDEKVNAIVIREEPAKLQLAERLLFAIDRREPEVQLDLEVLEVNRTKSLKYGVNFAKLAGAGIVPSGGSGSISTAPTNFSFSQLTSLGPESYLFTLPASVLVDFFKQDSDAKTLASPKLRVVNGKSASINIGDKQPILLSTTNVLPGQAATGAIPTTSTVTSIEFKDTGVKLTVEPTINVLDEVTLKIKVEVTRLGDQVTLQASPEIKQFKFGNRSAETVLMLKDEESVILAGLIQEEDRKTRSSVPWLGDLPVIGNLFSSTSEDRVETEVILTITPHVVRNLSAPPVAAQAFWSGTEAGYATTQTFTTQATKVSQPTPGAMAPVGKAERGVGVTGQGAQSVVPIPQSGVPPVPPATAPLVAEIPQNPVSAAPAFTGFKLRPTDVTSEVGKDLQLALTAIASEGTTEAQATVSFDPRLLEFQRIGPGVVAVTARADVGKVVLTFRRQEPGTGLGEVVLASLFFRALAVGEVPVTVVGFSRGGSSPVPPVADPPVMIHVR